MGRIYSIQSPKFETIEQGRREFLNILSQLRYAHDKQKAKHGTDRNYAELSGVIGLSMFKQAFVERVFVPVSAKGGRTIEIRRASWTPVQIDHKTDIHIHVYLAGTGASETANRVIRKKNKIYGRKKWIIRTRPESEGIPMEYVRGQSVNNGFRRIGHPEEYPEKSYVFF